MNSRTPHTACHRDLSLPRTYPVALFARATPAKALRGARAGVKPRRVAPL